MNVAYVYALFLGVMSILTFLVYAMDKYKAQKGKWRISEKRLLLLSFFGGAIGGYASMLLFRHKTKHWQFTAVNLLGILWQVALLVYLLSHPIILTL